jgi:hypothetical protein
MKPVAVPARPPALFHSPAPTTIFKRQTAIVPFELPRLSDKAAAQLIDALHQIVQGIEHHYAEQAHRYRKRQQDIAYARPTPSSNPTDPPF